MDRIIVIGRGMIGSAAARHLTSINDGITLIGPGEPADYAAHDGVFASHYDEGRMTRISDPDPDWAVTSKRSIERYPEIEAESGIPFFTNSRYLGIGGTDTSFLDRAEAAGRALGADLTRLDAQGIRALYPFLSVPDDADGLHEDRDAGHLNPRAMVKAQTEAARKRGATIVNDRAIAIYPVPGGVEVELASGDVRRAEKVLIATGGFTDACGLPPLDLKLRVFGRTVLLARMEGVVAEQLSDMPTMGHAETGAYILPPIRYPDGHNYLKIGIGTTDDPEFRSLTELNHWFKNPGSEENRDRFRPFLEGLIPALTGVAHWHTASCVVTWTATGLPYIDHVLDNRIAVAVGGNGKGAKSSDDWGWIAAHLVAGLDWEHPVGRAKLGIPGNIAG
ncbi:NAD(P)/FAD-dependent oxidoreductase [Nisaea nitritireducens]|uniref:NAD(P)/FAD-dependent oxidoreductase n=1 Tax=Nisaea nitritireducens TaxID=568392 RepID=UPI001867A6C1|nr:FAD-binding oxidoreductase [Nisaea nitritireducens]